MPDTTHAAAALRNPGLRFDPSMFAGIRVNRVAAERRAASFPARAPGGDTPPAWLLNAVRLVDLTTLAGDDTAGRVRRLCAKARRPLAPRILEGLGIEDMTLRVAAVCVYPTMVPHAVAALEGSGIPVASVATGFPAGLMPRDLRLREIEWAVAAGAAEIDIVITREHVLAGRWRALHEELAAMRAASGPAHMKAILATGELGTLTDVYAASMVAMQAGADFIKTSTGKEAVNATLPVSLVMARAIRDYRRATGRRVGFKPAGGITSAGEAVAWQVLMREELGRDWLEPERFRFGASSMLANLERRLDEIATGRVAARDRFAPS